MYAMNLTGPRTDPCETPQVSSVGSDRPVDALRGRPAHQSFLQA